MRVKFTGVSAFFKEAKREIKILKEKAKLEARVAALIVIQELMARTPVWSGETVRNYQVGVGSMPAGSLPPLGTVVPGATNKMPLGPEPRRGENQADALARATAAVAAFTDLSKSLFVTNTVRSDKWDLVDNGDAPARTDKLSPRYPGVVSVLALQSARAKLENFK